MQGHPTLIRNPQATRPWQHVLEPLSGYLTLAQRLYENPHEYTGSWNFGPDDRDTRPVSWIADRLVNLWDHGATWAQDNDPHPHEAHNLRLDSSKAHRLLNWRPRWNLDQALEAVVSWHRASRNGGDPQTVTVQQIDSYRLPTT